MRRASLILVALLLAGCAGMGMQSSDNAAVAELKNPAGQSVGTARFAQAGNVVGTATLTGAPDGARIALRVRGLRPGDHGVHVHEVGKCEPPAFTSAGGHYNPRNKKHGRLNPEGAHAGDLGNLRVGASGAGATEVTAAGVALTDVVGLSLVVHADRDDEKTDPAGSSGARVACGVIVK